MFKKGVLFRSLEKAGQALRQRPFLVLAVFVTLINFITMPKVSYRGDPMAIRASAAHLIKEGSFGIGLDQAPALRIFLEDRGQFFFFNEKKQRYFSKWGIVSALLFTPPLLADEMFFGIHADFSKPEKILHSAMYTDSLIFFLNLYNLGLGILVVFYLLKIAQLYTRSIGVAYFFVLCSIYGTFLWHYLRGQSLEIFQVLFFLGLTYHLILFLRSRQTTSPKWPQLLQAVAFAGLLATIKPLFVLLFPWLWIFSVAAPGKDGSWLRGTLDAVGADWKRYALWLALPTLAVTFIGMGLNDYQFGSPFETGYSQLNAGREVPHIRYAISFLPVAMKGYLFHPRYSIFLHDPLLLFALFGALAFFRKHPTEFGFICMVFLTYFTFFSCSSIWTGDWTYGPRYLLFLLPLVSLPFIETTEHLLTKIKGVFGLLGFGTILAVLLISVKLQISVNSLPFLVAYELEERFLGLESPEINGYFRNNPQGVVLGDFLAFRNQNHPFFPLELLKMKVPSDQQKFILQLEAILKKDPTFESNFFFFRDKDPG